MMPKNKKTRKPGSGMALSRVLTQQSREIKASHPPTYSAQSIRHILIRYRATAATALNLTSDDLAGMVGVVALTTVTTAYLASNVRLKRISVWGPVATAGVPVTSAIDYNSTSVDAFASPGSAAADTSVSFDHPAYVSRQPPSKAVAGMWLKVGATNPVSVVSLSCPSGSTVDFSIDFVLNDQGPPILGPVIVAGVAGEVYHLIIGTLTAVYVNTI